MAQQAKEPAAKPATGWKKRTRSEVVLWSSVSTCACTSSHTEHTVTSKMKYKRRLCGFYTNTNSLYIRHSLEAGMLAQQLRALTILAEDLGFDLQHLR